MTGCLGPLPYYSTSEMLHMCAKGGQSSVKLQHVNVNNHQ